ncbi:dynein heavy chain, cytosolic [Trypanosoma grayi]|uniref:dynein heavy chain, cytosolic n=1 Tax=Trypanosoma grayi TaxID=71804 RepID=UPI0004F4B964|nr:dynein heavy chain, cytosolic [Trypanosoma grayi]KEG06893.1 dynein heavy chain, cytosolic [Trypanosoma grayi]
MLKKPREAPAPRAAPAPKPNRGLNPSSPPPPAAAAAEVAREVISKEKPLTLDALLTNGCNVRVSVNDLVAYEYVDKQKHWQWGLATVAALPGPRLVQLLLWRHDGTLRSSSQAPATVNISEEERRKAVQRLEQLRQQRDRVQEEAETMNRNLASRQAAYAAARRRIETEANAAEQTLMEARTRVKQIEARDWREIRCYRNPPAIIVLVMEAVLSVLGEHCVSWTQMQSVIRSSDFVHKVEQFDPSRLSDLVKRNVWKKYISNPRFTYADAMNGSQALGYLQQWVVAHVATANATESLVEYDIAHADERAALSGLEQQLGAFQRALREYNSEEDRLRAVLEGEPLVLRKKPHNAATSCSNISSNSGNIGIDKSKENGREYEEAGEVQIIPEADQNMIVPRNGPIPQPMERTKNNMSDLDDEHEEHIHGTNAIWSFTDEIIVTLRSAILCNYDKPEGTILRLTPEQVQEIEDALTRRSGNWDQEKHADDERRKLQNALEDLRGRHARTLKRLQELESGNHGLQRELEDRERELERLNQAINEHGVPLQTPRYSVTGSSLRSTPRAGVAAAQLAAAAAAAAATPLADKLMDAEEDPAEKIADLEERLRRALHDNPTEAQVQLLEDDLRAVQEELRQKKEELDSFRNAISPSYYTSSALRMDKESTPEAQLAAAQRQIEELEAALEEALAIEQLRDQEQGERRQPSVDDANKVDELQAHVQRMQAEVQQQRRDAEIAAERLNDELHAHEATRDTLAAKEQELQALWERQNRAEGEKESTRDALHASEGELEKLRDQLREAEENVQQLQDQVEAARLLEGERQRDTAQTREDRVVKMRGVIDQLMQESHRQKHEANSTGSVLEEVRALLGNKVVI